MISCCWIIWSQNLANPNFITVTLLIRYLHRCVSLFRSYRMRSAILCSSQRIHSRTWHPTSLLTDWKYLGRWHPSPGNTRHQLRIAQFLLVIADRKIGVSVSVADLLLRLCTYIEKFVEPLENDTFRNEKGALHHADWFSWHFVFWNIFIKIPLSPSFARVFHSQSFLLPSFYVAMVRTLSGFLRLSTVFLYLIRFFYHLLNLLIG